MIKRLVQVCLAAALCLAGNTGSGYATLVISSADQSNPGPVRYIIPGNMQSDDQQFIKNLCDQLATSLGNRLGEGGRVERRLTESFDETSCRIQGCKSPCRCDRAVIVKLHGYYILQRFCGEINGRLPDTTLKELRAERKTPVEEIRHLIGQCFSPIEEHTAFHKKLQQQRAQ